jgi:hypothetical protein
MAKQLEKKHPLAIRWLHWINFPLLTLDDLERNFDLLG